MNAMDPLSARLAGLVPRNLPRPEPEALRSAVGRPPAPWIATVAGWYLPLTVVGLAGLVTAALGAWLWLGVLCFVAVAAAEWAGARVVSPLETLLTLSGWTRQVRALVRDLLLVVVTARAEPDALVPLMLTVALIQLIWLGFGALGVLAGSRQPLVGFVPGAGRQPAPTVAFAAIRGYEAGVVLVYFELAAALITLLPDRVTGLAFGLLAVLLIAVAGVLLLRARRVLASAATAEQQLVDDINREGPTALVYITAGTGQGRHLLSPWLPTLEALPDGCLIVVREASHLATLEATSLRVVYAPTSRNLERAIVPSLRVAFFLGNSAKNIDLQRYPNLRHVFLGHGDSDKSPSANPMARVYDQIWVAGQAAIDRYAAAGVDLPADRFVIVGRPQVEQLRRGPLGQQPPTVLYAPTFEGYLDETNYTSLETMGPEIVRRLLAHRPAVRICFRPHPSTGLLRPGMRAARIEVDRLLSESGGDHLGSHTQVGRPLQEAFDAADVLIADVSGVASDFLWTLRPIIAGNPRALTAEEFARRYPSQSANYLLTAPEQIDQIIDLALGDDPGLPGRTAIAGYVLGEHPDGPTATFIAATRRLAAQPR